MLSRKNRFHGHGSVRRVYRLGKPARTAFFSMHTSRGDKVKSTKVAVVVSRKVDKSSVRRNRIRRRIYEYMRHHLADIQTPTEIVITVYRPDVGTMTAAELESALKDLASKARL